MKELQSSAFIAVQDFLVMFPEDSLGEVNNPRVLMIKTTWILKEEHEVHT